MLYDNNRGIEAPIYVSVPDFKKGDNLEAFVFKFDRNDRRAAKAFDGYLIDIKEGGYDFAGDFKKTICFVISDFDNEERNYEFSISADGFAVVNMLNQLASAAKNGFDFAKRKIFFNSKLSLKLNKVGNRSFEIKISDGKKLFDWYKSLDELTALGVYGTARTDAARLKFVDGAVKFIKKHLETLDYSFLGTQSAPAFEEPEIDIDESPVPRKSKGNTDFDNEFIENLKKAEIQAQKTSDKIGTMANDNIHKIGTTESIGDPFEEDVPF